MHHIVYWKKNIFKVMHEMTYLDKDGLGSSRKNLSLKKSDNNVLVLKYNLFGYAKY